MEISPTAALDPNSLFLCNGYQEFSILRNSTFSRFGAIASSSSINRIAGEFFSHSSNALRKLDSDSPANLLIISGPENTIKSINILIRTIQPREQPEYYMVLKTSIYHSGERRTLQFHLRRLELLVFCRCLVVRITECLLVAETKSSSDSKILIFKPINIRTVFTAYINKILGTIVKIPNYLPYLRSFPKSLLSFLLIKNLNRRVR